jgi:hypothetical protein
VAGKAFTWTHPLNGAMYRVRRLRNGLLKIVRVIRHADNEPRGAGWRSHRSRAAPTMSDVAG